LTKSESGVDRYSDLPELYVLVGEMDTEPVNNPEAVDCAVGGNSVPMLVDIDELPFYDITVKLEK